MNTKAGSTPSNCENCGKRLYAARLGNQCLYCGHRTDSGFVQFTQRGVQFLVINSLVWLAIVLDVVRLTPMVGVLATTATALCLFGGLILRRWLSMVGDWVAVAVTAVMVFMVLQAIKPH